MKNIKVYDLELAVQQWRNSMKSRGSFNPEELAELEAHLRDEIDNLEGLGLNKEEAVLIAQHRLGSVKTLESAYSNTPGTKFKKVSLALQALIFLFLFKELTVLFSWFGSDVILANNLNNSVLNFGISIGFQLLAITILAIVFKLLLKWHNQDRSNWRANLFMAGSFLFLFVLKAAYFSFVGYVSALYEPVTVAATMSYLPVLITLMTLIFIIYKEIHAGKASALLSS